MTIIKVLDQKELNSDTLYWDRMWESLKKTKYVWIDKSGCTYLEEDLKDSHLLNILKYLNRNYRPLEQIATLTGIAKKRGLIE